MEAKLEANSLCGMLEHTTITFETIVGRIDLRRVLEVRHGACKVSSQSASIKVCISAEIKTFESAQKSEDLVRNLACIQSTA